MKRKHESVFDFKLSREEYQPGETDKLITKMAETLPILQDILNARSLDEQIAIIQQGVSPEYYEHVLMQLGIIEYFYKQKDKLLERALAIAELNYRLALMLPPEWDLQKGYGLSPARHVADALESLGSIYSDLGDLSRTLDYYLQAEEWYVRDDVERSQRGITARSDYDRLFHERDVRAGLFENMSRLYLQLGDTQKAAEYARRMSEIDRRYSTIETRIALLLRYGNAAGAAGDVDRALQNFHEALDLAVSDPHSKIVVRGVTQACHSIGDTMHYLGLFRQALRYHQRALELNRQVGHSERMNYDYRAVGRVFEARPDLGDALDAYEHALQCVSITVTTDASFTWSASDGTRFRVIDPDLAWEPALAIGRVYTQRQQYNRADEFFALAIDLGEVMRSNVIQDEYRIGFQANRMLAYKAMIKLHSQLSIEALANGNATRGSATRAWRYAERARSRAFLDLLSTSFIRPPDEIPVSLQNEEAALIERLRALSQVRQADGVEQKRTVWDEYEDARASLEKVWQNMISIAPSSIGYVELRRGRPLEMRTLHELLRGE